MVDVDKELGSLFEKLGNERNIMAEENQKTEQSIKEESYEFKHISDSSIAPVMLEYQNYLQKKGIDTEIVREPKPGETTLHKPTISFIINDQILTGQLGAPPSIKYSLEDEKVLETIQGKATIAKEYPKEEITQDLVASTLTSSIKACYHKETSESV
jgi:hypothetical protein